MVWEGTCDGERGNGSWTAALWGKDGVPLARAGEAIADSNGRITVSPWLWRSRPGELGLGVSREDGGGLSAGPVWLRYWRWVLRRRKLRSGWLRGSLSIECSGDQGPSTTSSGAGSGGAACWVGGWLVCLGICSGSAARCTWDHWHIGSLVGWLGAPRGRYNATAQPATSQPIRSAVAGLGPRLSCFPGAP